MSRCAKTQGDWDRESWWGSGHGEMNCLFPPSPFPFLSLRGDLKAASQQGPVPDLVFSIQPTHPSHFKVSFYFQSLYQKLARSNMHKLIHTHTHTRPEHVNIIRCEYTQAHKCSNKNEAWKPHTQQYSTYRWKWCIMGSGLNCFQKMRKYSHQTFHLASPPCTFLCVTESIVSVPEENNKRFHQEEIF